MAERSKSQAWGILTLPVLAALVLLLAFQGAGGSVRDDAPEIEVRFLEVNFDAVERQLVDQLEELSGQVTWRGRVYTEPSGIGTSRDTGIFFGTDSNANGAVFANRTQVALAETINGFGFTNFGLSPFASADGEWLGSTHLRFSDISGLDVDIQDFESQEIDLVPSNYAPPASEEETAAAAAAVAERARERRARFEKQWKAIMEDLERSLLPQIESISMPGAWLDDIAQRRPHERRSWKRATARPNASKLTVGLNDELPLQAFEASVRIDGFRARVVLDLFYENDREEVLEGNFKLRLPDGATPYYLAFGPLKLQAPTHTGGVPLATPAAIRRERERAFEDVKEGRIVPRETAAHAYGETVRRQVDPALMEWSGAGLFETRVFPLTPNKTHRIVVGYELDLQAYGGSLHFELPLPKDVPDTRVNVQTHGVRARVHPATPAMAGRYGWHDPEAAAIRVRVPDPGALVLSGHDAQVGEHFAVRLAPSLPRLQAVTRERAVFLVDVSLSENPERFNTWLALLEEILTRNRPALREFAVAFFNVETFWWRAGLQANTAQNVAALRTFANGLALEGATDVGQALRTARAVQGPCDLFLLSNGAITWGEDDLQALSTAIGQDRTLFTYVTGAAGTDRRLLHHLARSSGGAVFTVNDASALRKAAVAHTLRPWRLDDLSLPGSRDLLLSGAPRTIYPDQELLLVGRGVPEAGAAVTLTVSRGSETRRLRLPLGDRIDSPLAVSAYGQVAVEQLESLGHELPRETRAYAQHYRVVGRTCSLLMLESEEDYKRFGIVPADDAGLIGKQALRARIEAFLGERGASLADPRARLLRLCRAFDRLVPQEPALADVLTPLVAQLPAGTFHVEAKPLRCRQHARAEVGRAFREACASGEIQHAVALAEAEARARRHGAADALKAFSALVEARPGDSALARDVGAAAIAWELPGQAYHILRRVAERRPHELPIYLAIARCLSDMGRDGLALVHYELARAAGANPLRFGDFGQVAGMEYLRFLGRVAVGDGPADLKALAATRATALRAKIGPAQADLVVVMAWNTDRTDVDLHVTDPSGEECYYEHRQTKQGGRMGRDVTTGYGPEIFVLERAAPGTYKIEALNFSVDGVRTGVRSRVDVTIYEDWGKPGERVTRRSTYFEAQKARVELARVERK